MLYFDFNIKARDIRARVFFNVMFCGHRNQ